MQQHLNFETTIKFVVVISCYKNILYRGTNIRNMHAEIVHRVLNK